jgi:hypothetical protein
MTRIGPLGGDKRFKVSSDGLTLIDGHRMHRTILMLDPASGGPPGSSTQALFHTDIYSTLPEDTDVFHVLASKRHCSNS